MVGIDFLFSFAGRVETKGSDHCKYMMIKRVIAFLICVSVLLFTPGLAAADPSDDDENGSSENNVKDPSNDSNKNDRNDSSSKNDSGANSSDDEDDDDREDDNREVDDDREDDDRESDDDREDDDRESDDDNREDYNRDDDDSSDSDNKSEDMEEDNVENDKSSDDGNGSDGAAEDNADNDNSSDDGNGSDDSDEDNTENASSPEGTSLDDDGQEQDGSGIQAEDNNESNGNANDTGSNTAAGDPSGFTDPSSTDNTSDTSSSSDSSGSTSTDDTSETGSSSSSSGSTSTGDTSETGSSSDSSGSTSSGSNSFGSFIPTPESYENIEFTDLSFEPIVSGKEALFEFTGGKISIISVSFIPQVSGGQVRTMVESLKDTSGFVNEAPPGTVYKNLNVWIGNGQYSPYMLNEAKVNFKVEKQWLESNSVGYDSILLYNYHGKWNPLTTDKTGEDEEYVYYTARTPGFSIFAISTDENMPLSSGQEGDNLSEGNGSVLKDGSFLSGNMADNSARSTISYGLLMLGIIVFVLWSIGLVFIKNRMSLDEIAPQLRSQGEEVIKRLKR